MYEPTRSRALRAPAPAVNAAVATPRLSREDHLDAQLAGHLAALLTVTEQLRSRAGQASPDLGEATRRIGERIAQLSPDSAPTLIWEGSQPRPEETREAGAIALHRRAHILAGRVLVVAASRQDTATAMLACRRMDAHAEALSSTPVPV